LKFKKLQSQFKVNVESKGREIVTSSKFRKCPCCKTGNLVIIEIFDSRGPPRGYTLGVCQIKSPHNQ
ncbi:MAG: hypothetical protein KA327_04125, partial [Pseudarcicella sp.]|nr:hypothetical protein [Pseudarcicella sp.]